MCVTNCNFMKFVQNQPQTQYHKHHKHGTHNGTMTILIKTSLKMTLLTTLINGILHICLFTVISKAIYK
jgi:hypothetical protein